VFTSRSSYATHEPRLLILAAFLFALGAQLRRAVELCAATLPPDPLGAGVELCPPGVAVPAVRRPVDSRRDCLADRRALERAERPKAEGEPHRSDRGRRWVAAEFVLEVDELGHRVGEPPVCRRAVAVIAWGRWRRRGWLRGVTVGVRNGVEDDRWGELASGWRFAVCDLGTGESGMRRVRGALCAVRMVRVRALDLKRRPRPHSSSD
jgi:hypothetical protein